MQCNSFFLPTYRPSALNESLAQSLVVESRPLLKEKLILWTNGGPEQIESNTTITTSSSDEDALDVELFDISGSQFNSKLVDMDCAAKQLAEKFPRGFGASYLATLIHGNAQQDFTPAIQITSAPVTAVRFGNRGLNNRGTKRANEISKIGSPRARARGVMNTAAIALKKKMDWLVDMVDEVNKRPAIRKYRQPRTNVPIASSAIDQVLLDNEIADLEIALCAKYRQRSALIDVIDMPTPAVTLVAGPRHNYDTTTMFQFTNNVPDNYPIPKLFRAFHSIRDDDVPQNREDSRSKKRERHAVSSSEDLGKSKEIQRTGGVD